MIYTILIGVLIAVVLAVTRNALIHQNGAGNITLGTLGANGAVAFDATFAGTTNATFLVKRIRYLCSIDGVTVGQGPFGVVLANGDVTGAEASAAYTEGWTTGPADRTQELTQDNAWNVYHNSYELLTPFDDGSKWISSGDWISLGKGYPMPEISGWQVFVISHDQGALTTGASMNGIVQYQGVWLGQ